MAVVAHERVLYVQEVDPVGVEGPMLDGLFHQLLLPIIIGLVVLEHKVFM